MADTDVLIKDLPLTETVNDSDDLVTEDSSPTTHRIKASVVKNYINAEQNDELEGFRIDLDNTNSNIGSLSSKVDEATVAVSNMQTSLNSMENSLSGKVDKAGDTMTGNLYIEHSGNTMSRYQAINSYGKCDLEISNAGNRGIYDGNADAWTIRRAVDTNNTTVGDSTTQTNIMGSTVQINGTAVSDMLSISTVSTDNITISASSNYSFSVSASRSGYTPIAVVSYSISNASSSGANSSVCNVYGYWLSGTTAYANVRNTATSSSAVVEIALRVLYIKN